jgi:hypothetical protein
MSQDSIRPDGQRSSVDAPPNLVRVSVDSLGEGIASEPRETKGSFLATAAPSPRACPVCGGWCQGSAAPADNGAAVCGDSGPWQPFGGRL